MAAASARARGKRSCRICALAKVRFERTEGTGDVHDGACFPR